MDTPVTYLCDTTANTLSRYDGYAIVGAQPTDPSASPLSGAASALVSNRLAGCAITYQPGTSQRAGLVTMELELEERGERVRLLHQVHVVNVP